MLERPAKQKKEGSIPTTEYTTFQTVGDPVQWKIVVLDWAESQWWTRSFTYNWPRGEKIKTAGDGRARREK